jgi:polyhydroxyalkanoate synthesis regulator phasin
MEPAGSKPGQQQAKAGSASGGSATGEQASAEGNDTATATGAMTRDEARQVLDSLKNSERKLPATDYDAQKEGAEQSSDQPFRDW